MQWDRSAPAHREMVAPLHLPIRYILHGTVLFDLSFPSCANFSPLSSFSSSLLMGEQHFNVVTLVCRRVYEVLQSALLQQKLLLPTEQHRPKA